MGRKAQVGEYAGGSKSGRSAAAGHGLRVGDLLYIAFGRDKTVVQFYEVVRASGSVVDMRQRKTEVSRVAGQNSFGLASPGDGFESDRIYSRHTGPSQMGGFWVDGVYARRFIRSAGIPCTLES